MVPFQRAIVVSYRLSTVTIALSLNIQLQFTIECCRCLNKQGVIHFGAQFGEEGVDLCQPNFNMIWERHGWGWCVQKKLFRYLLPFKYNA